MSWKIPFSLGCCLTTLGLLTAGCAPAAAPAPTSRPAASTAIADAVVKTGASPEAKPAALTPTAKPAADQPRFGGILSRANYEDPPNLDVHQASGAKEHLSLANVYSALVRLDPIEVNKVVPDLADRWEVSPDGKVYTFYLRKGVNWHDGKPFTSEDAKYSLERMAFWKEHNIVSPRGGALLSTMEKAEATDPSTVKVTMKYPSASFLGNAAAGWVVMVPKHVIQAKGDLKKDAVGTGPFKWKAWNFGIGIELVKNPDYFVKGRPYLDGITLYTIKDDATSFAAFRTGRVKMTGIASKALTHVQADIVRREMADKIVVADHAATMRYLILTHFKRKPWDDLRVRQAVDLAFDRKAAIAINDNVGMVGAAMHPQGDWGIQETEMTKRPGYRQPKDADIAEAKRLLAEAGYPQGFKTRMLVRAGGATERQGLVAADQLLKIGIEAAIDARETGSVLDLMNRHNFDISSYNPADPTDDPDAVFSAYYTTGGSRNFGEFSDKQIDDLFNKQTAILDEKERKKVVLEMQQRILDLAAYPVMFWDVYHLGFWKEVRGFKPGFGPYTHNSLDHVWLAQ